MVFLKLFILLSQVLKNATTCVVSIGVQTLLKHYSQTRSSVPVTSKLMNSLMEK